MPAVEAPAPEEASRRWLVQGAQVLVSILVLGLLLKDADLSELSSLLASLSAPWLLGALGLKALALLVHELRLWLVFNPPRPPLLRVTAIGLAGGMLNLVLPARAGDMAAIALLRRECKVSLGAATAAVGVASFLEAAVFGLALVGILVAGAPRWEQVIGASAHRDALHWVTAATLAGIGVAVLAVITGRRLKGAPPEAGPSALTLVRETLHQGSQSLLAPLRLLGHIGLAAIDVALTVGAFALALPAVGLDVPLPLLAASFVLALSALASVVLPPSYGAGPAAASVAVLSVFGVEQAPALAYAGAWWLVSQGPSVILGMPCLLGRGRA